MPRITQHYDCQFEDTMNLKRILFSACLPFLLAAARPLRAQTGCVDSPEDPTIVLALVAGAGALVAGLCFSRSRRQ
jgi:XrtJ-associated TM-motif-TM protein